MKGSEEDDVIRTLFETNAFGLVLILLMLNMPGS